MKRAAIFVVLTIVLFLSCATQSQSPINNTHWIVGTWTQEGGTVWVFNENGTGTMGKENFIYGISAGSEIYLSNGWGARKIFISPDGKEMIIMGVVFQKTK
jgi:hypothetical protein